MVTSFFSRISCADVLLIGLRRMGERRLSSGSEKKTRPNTRWAQSGEVAFLKNLRGWANVGRGVPAKEHRSGPMCSR